MGGKVSDRNRIIGAVVPREVKDFLVSQVKTGRFRSISEAAKYYLLLAIGDSNRRVSDKVESENGEPRKSRLRSFWRRE